MDTKNIKNFLKGLPVVGDLLANIRKRKRASLVAKSFDTYQKRYLRYSISLKDGYENEAMRRSIIIDSHILEKGLSHSDFRPGFGKTVVIELQECLQDYVKYESYDVFAVSNAVSLLKKYHTMNAENGFDDGGYLHLEVFSQIKTSDLSPYIVVNNEAGKSEFEKIAKSRHSVRCYSNDGIEVNPEILRKVIALANTAPSACNRQATHIFAVTDRDKFGKIEQIHKGCKGFGQHVSMFLFIASDLSLYTVNEFKLPIFDAGIYTMNLLYSLESYGLHSCVLNATFPREDTERIHAVTGIPDKYEINGLIAVYNLPKAAEMIIAASPRREIDDILTVM